MPQLLSFSSLHTQIDVYSNLTKEEFEGWELLKLDPILERPLHGTSPYHVLGDLILPSPTTCSLSEVHQKLAGSLVAHLQQLQGRDLSGKLSRIKAREKC